MSDEIVEYCGVCKFFSLESQCRRRAPQVLVVPKANTQELTWQWPQVFVNDWCGEFERLKTEQSLQQDELLSKSVHKLGFELRARKCMCKLSINTLGELVARTGYELLECRNFGVIGLERLRIKLAELGLRLRGE